MFAWFRSGAVAILEPVRGARRGRPAAGTVGQRIAWSRVAAWSGREASTSGAASVLLVFRGTD